MLLDRQKAARIASAAVRSDMKRRPSPRARPLHGFDGARAFGLFWCETRGDQPGLGTSSEKQLERAWVSATLVVADPRGALPPAALGLARCRSQTWSPTRATIEIVEVPLLPTSCSRRPLRANHFDLAPGTRSGANRAADDMRPSAPAVVDPLTLSPM